MTISCPFESKLHKSHQGDASLGICLPPAASAENLLMQELVEVQIKMQLQQWEAAEAQADAVSPVSLDAETKASTRSFET